MRGSYILSTQVSTSDFSSDLSGGRRPESKSDEKLEVDTLIHDLSRCEHSFTVKKVLQLFRASVLDCCVLRVHVACVWSRSCERGGWRAGVVPVRGPPIVCVWGEAGRGPSFPDVAAWVP